MFQGSKPIHGCYHTTDAFVAFSIFYVDFDIVNTYHSHLFQDKTRIELAAEKLSNSFPAGAFSGADCGWHTLPEKFIHYQTQGGGERCSWDTGWNKEFLIIKALSAQLHMHLKKHIPAVPLVKDQLNCWGRSSNFPTCRRKVRQPTFKLNYVT